MTQHLGTWEAKCINGQHNFGCLKAQRTCEKQKVTAHSNVHGTPSIVYRFITANFVHLKHKSIGLIFKTSMNENGKVQKR
jgi:hypothetical protein